MLPTCQTGGPGVQTPLPAGRRFFGPWLATRTNPAQPLFNTDRARRAGPGIWFPAAAPRPQCPSPAAAPVLTAPSLPCPSRVTPKRLPGDLFGHSSGIDQSLGEAAGRGQTAEAPRSRAAPPPQPAPPLLFWQRGYFRAQSETQEVQRSTHWSRLPTPALCRGGSTTRTGRHLASLAACEHCCSREDGGGGTLLPQLYCY